MKTTTQPRAARIIGILLMSFAAAAFAAPSTVLADAKIYQQTLKSTAWILAKASDGFSTGSGVLIDRERRLVITNSHVLGDEHEAAVFFPQKKDGRTVVERKFYYDQVDTLGIKAKVVALDRRRDLAILQLPSLPDDVTPIEMAAEPIGPGENVHSLGNATSTEVLWAYTSGTVRAVYRKHFRTGAGEHDFTAVETQSPINSGDSGGPVVNDEGKLVAIAQSLDPEARLVSFCVDLSDVKALLAEDWKPVPAAMTEVLTNAGLKFTKDEVGPYAVEAPAGGANEMPVYVGDRTEFYGKAEVRKIWALAMTSKSNVSADVAMQLLQQNARTKMGAWTIEQNEQGEFLVIFCVKIDAGASAEAIKSSMEYVSKMTLAMSQQLGGTAAATNPAAPQPVAPAVNEKASEKSDVSDWFGGYQP